MTNGSPGSPEPARADDDQHEHSFSYGHGRLPLFMKIVWFLFLAFATWYVVEFLLTSVGKELGA
jgi:hypothetical protein